MTRRGMATIVFLLVAHASCLMPAAASARDPRQVVKFRREHPCPSTNKTRGACSGYVVDHIVPLCWGGPDEPANMQWQETRASYLKDKFEREACRLKAAAGRGK